MTAVIPTYNRARHLPAAIRSVLDQSERDLELIVVDDGSTDETPSVLEPLADPRLRVVRIPRSGSAAHARNVAVAEARGRYLAFLDSDDIWLEGKLERQLRALRAAPGCRWSYTLFDHMDEDGAWMAPLKGGVGAPLSGWIVHEMVSEEALVMIQTVVAETDLVRDVGGFDETPEIREDLDLCLRLAVRAPTCAVDAQLTRIRHHVARTTYEMPEVRAWRVRALDKLARATDDEGLRDACRRECGRELVELARVQGGAGRPGAALRTLRRAAAYGRRDPKLWTTVLETLVRPLTPRAVRRLRRRRRERSEGVEGQRGEGAARA